MGKLYVRVDDYPGTKPNEFSKHNLENYKKFHNLITKFVDSYILGVIPGYTRNLDLQWFKENKNIIVALHGVNHDESKLDEFKDKDYNSTLNSLNIVKTIFDKNLGYSVNDYIPPHNVINKDTVLALKKLGVEYIYGGPETSDYIKEYIITSGINYVHSQPPLEYGRSDELLQRGSVEHIREKLKFSNVWLGLHWTWEHNIGLENLDLYLSKVFE